LSARGLAVALAGPAMVSIATLAGIDVALRSAAASESERDADQAARTLAQRLADELEVLNSEVRILADEPRVRALLEATSIDQETLLDVAEETRRTAKLDVLGLAAADGSIWALAGSRSDERPPMIAKALAGKPASGYSVDANVLVQSAATPVQFGKHVIGAVFAGRRLDDARIVQLGTHVGGPVAFYVGDKLVAAHFERDASPAELALLGHVPNRGEVHLNGSYCLVRQVTLEPADVRAVVLTPRERDPRGRRRLQFEVLGIAGLGLIAAAMTAATRRTRAFPASVARGQS
jgi:hypothetical protein